MQPDDEGFDLFAALPRELPVSDGEIDQIVRRLRAERAGLEVGDLVVKVEGHSVLDDEGAKGLARLDRVDVLHLSVRRDGNEIDYTLKVNDKLD